MKDYIERLKELYDRGAIDKAAIDKLYQAKKITKAEHDYIVSANKGAK